MYHHDPELESPKTYSAEIKTLLIRLFAFIFFTFIVALVLINRFIEHGRVLIMLIVIFPLVLMFGGLLIGLAISNLKPR